MLLEYVLNLRGCFLRGQIQIRLSLLLSRLSPKTNSGSGYRQDKPSRCKHNVLKRKCFHESHCRRRLGSMRIAYSGRRVAHILKGANRAILVNVITDWRSGVLIVHPEALAVYEILSPGDRYPLGIAQGCISGSRRRRCLLFAPRMTCRSSMR